MNLNGNLFQTSSNILNGFDAVVDTGGTGDHTTLQAADDVLDAGAYSMFVKQGTYGAGLTVSTNNVYIFVEPGTVITAAIVLSGTGIRLELGAQCDIQSTITLSGSNCSLICHGGCDIDGLIVSGAQAFIDGGGLDTISNGGTARPGIDVNSGATDVLIQHISAQTTAGGGAAHDAIDIAEARCTLESVKVVDADDVGIIVSGADCHIRNTQVLGADDYGMYIDGPRSIVTGCYVINSGAVGIGFGNSGDGAVVVANIVQDPGGDSIDIPAACEDVVVVGNKTDGAVDDNSGTSTVASNEETAF
jgi:hypothetical protein